MDEQFQIVVMPDGEEVEFPASMSDDQISSIIKGMSGQSEVQQTAAAPPAAVSAPSPVSDDGSGGGLLAAGAAVANAGKVRPLVAGIGNKMAKTSKGGMIRGIGGAAGAGLGASLGASVGLSPFAGATLGAMAGSHAAKKYVIPTVKSAGTKLAGAVGTAMPRLAGGKFGPIPAGRSTVNKIAGKVLPGVGGLMMLYDLLGLSGTLREELKPENFDLGQNINDSLSYEMLRRK